MPHATPPVSSLLFTGRFLRQLTAATDPSPYICNSSLYELVSLRRAGAGDGAALRCPGWLAQLHLQCGPHRVVSLISLEAAHELGLEPGSLAVAVVKSTQVVIETSNRPLLPRRGDPNVTRSSKPTEVNS